MYQRDQGEDRLCKTPQGHRATEWPRWVSNSDLHDPEGQAETPLPDDTRVPGLWKRTTGLCGYESYFCPIENADTDNTYFKVITKSSM